MTETIRKSGNAFILTCPAREGPGHVRFFGPDVDTLRRRADEYYWPAPGSARRYKQRYLNQHANTSVPRVIGGTVAAVIWERRNAA